MTENEAQMKLSRSPSETAFKLILHCGVARALAFVSSWIKVLANLRRPPLETIAFWASVAMRLKGIQPIECAPTVLTPFDRAGFSYMIDRVGV